MLAGKIFLEAFASIKAGEKEVDVIDKTIKKLSHLLGVYVAGEKKILWQEIKRLFDAGVIKKAALIDYVMEAQGYTHQEAVKYVAETFGMKDSTQSVYLSDELKLRQKEKTAKRRKSKRL